MSKKKEEEVYQVTLKGLLYLTLEDNHLAQKVVDTLELYLRRHHSKGGHPGIVFNLSLIHI
jgi:hypothetical protein